MKWFWDLLKKRTLGWVFKDGFQRLPADPGPPRSHASSKTRKLLSWFYHCSLFRNLLQPGSHADRETSATTARSKNVPYLLHSQPQNTCFATYLLNTKEAVHQSWAPLLTLPWKSQILYRLGYRNSRIKSTTSTLCLASELHVCIISWN